MHLTDSETARLMLTLALLLVAAHGVGELFARYRQPRVIGEILGGLLLGPTVFGYLLPDVQEQLFPSDGAIAPAIGAMYSIGLVLLVFVAGVEIGSTSRKGERRTSAMVTVTGLVIPFGAGVAAMQLLDLSFLEGPAHDPRALMLVFGAAVAITSIPVISRIMIDLGVANTPFGRIVLGAAVMEDIALYAVLAMAVGLTQSGQVGLASQLGIDPTSAGGAAYYAGATALLFAFAMTAGRHIRASAAEGTASTPDAQPRVLAWLLVTLLVITLACVALSLTSIVGGLAAGIMVGEIKREDVGAALRAITTFAFAFFVPLYFAVVGFRLDLIHNLDPVFFLAFLLFACLVKSGSVYLGARLAGESTRASGNLALALNARGGPGIVLASVAFDARIISEQFHVSLVLLALVTSLLAGSWLERVVRSGQPLRPTGPLPAPIRHPAGQTSEAGS